MNGLLQGGQAPAGSVPETPVSPTTAPNPQGIGEVNQEEIDIFVANGMKIVHNPKMSDMIISSIVKSKNPVSAIANATVKVVEKLEESAQTAGKKMSLATVAHGANFIMGEIVVTAEAAGMKKIPDEVKAQALSLAVGMYIDNAIKSGKMTKEEVIQLGKEAGESPEGQKVAATASKMAAAGPGAQGGVPAPPPGTPGMKGVMDNAGIT